MDALDAFGPLALASRPAAAQTDISEAARAFEGLLLGSIQRTAARPIGGEHWLDGGSAGRMAREMWLQELATLAVRENGLGLERVFESRTAPQEAPE